MLWLRLAELTSSLQNSCCNEYLGCASNYVKGTKPP